jgi:hypothetical protein
MEADALGKPTGRVHVIALGRAVPKIGAVFG